MLLCPVFIPLKNNVSILSLYLSTWNLIRLQGLIMQAHITPSKGQQSTKESKSAKAYNKKHLKLDKCWPVKKSCEATIQDNLSLPKQNFSPIQKTWIKKLSRMIHLFSAPAFNLI